MDKREIHVPLAAWIEPGEKVNKGAKGNLLVSIRELRVTRGHSVNEPPGGLTEFGADSGITQLLHDNCTPRGALGGGRGEAAKGVEPARLFLKREGRVWGVGHGIVLKGG